MKIILFGFLVAILAVQKNKAGVLMRPDIHEMMEMHSPLFKLGGIPTSFEPYEVMVLPEDEAAAHLLFEIKEASIEGSTEDSTEDSNKTEEEKLEKVVEKFEKLEEMFVENGEKFGKLEEKVEDLRKTVTAIQEKQLPTFEKIGSKYYYIDDSEGVNWFEAAHKCRELGGNLAGLQSEDEWKAVSEKLTKGPYWLDINDLGNEGVYKLLSSGQEAGYLNWHFNEPNDREDNENCVELIKYGSKWAMNDNNCAKKFNFICEKDNLE
ncbi:mannose-binding protein A-like isoform X2 [Drosophila innubila]|uniref:mannose-binding protein A-like isoform X2 n=1 Tax=Drosophila innubila TaxID=198719 RepID=UPI00148E603E|nr:mannose-binding protein A-like isoform X2 [Drosophila innubila]